jgi:hypothetical protein
LDVHGGGAFAVAHDFRQPVRAAGVVRRSHFHAAKILRHLPDARVVRGHNDVAQGLRALALLDDVLDERLAGDQRQWLAGKTRGSIARGNDANDVHRLDLATDETQMKHRFFGNGLNDAWLDIANDQAGF